MSTAIRALVVDDAREIREQVRRYLSLGKIFASIDEASTAEGALSRAQGAQYALIVLDLGLPDRDGLEIIPELLASQTHATLLCLTGRDESGSNARALHAGATAYLLKPINREELRVFADRAVARQLKETRAELARRAAAAAPGLAPSASQAWIEVLEQVREASRSDKATVLLRGESGTGKDVVAGLIHRFSARAAGPYVTSNVAALSPNLVESELFGHESGAYTGATGLRRGLFELAADGTLFLDEIGDLPLETQPRLLRVLEGHPFRRLGGEREVQPNVRVIAATNQDLEGLVARGVFRADLLYRLKVYELRLPALRERKEDVEGLIIHFLGRLSEGDPRLGIEREALQLMSDYAWPGNVRELQNVVERAAIASHGEPIEVRHLPKAITGGAAPPSRPPTPPPISAQRELGDLSLEWAIRIHVEKVFNLCDRNLSRSARALGLSRVALRRRLRAYGLIGTNDELPVVGSEPPAEAPGPGLTNNLED